MKTKPVVVPGEGNRKNFIATSTGGHVTDQTTGTKGETRVRTPAPVVPPVEKVEITEEVTEVLASVAAVEEEVVEEVTPEPEEVVEEVVAAI